MKNTKLVRKLMMGDKAKCVGCLHRREVATVVNLHGVLHGYCAPCWTKVSLWLEREGVKG